MVYQVEFRKSAAKEFQALPKRIKDSFKEALILLSHHPYSELLKAKKIKGDANLYRIRQGDYRLVYEVQEKKLIIIVVKVGHRRDIYKRLRK